MSRPLPTVAILAGGLATRLRPVTDTIPKSLAPVCGRPFLSHQLALLREQDFKRVALCVGHLADQIEAAFGDGRSHEVSLNYSHDGPRPIGTAAALRQALPLLGDSFLVLYGDSYLEIDYQEVVAAFERSGQPALMTVIRESPGLETPNVWFENGTVRAYAKKNPLPQMRHIDYGLGVYRASEFASFSAGATDLGDVQARLAAGGAMAGFEVTAPYFEIGSPHGLAALESHLQAQSRA